MHFGSGLYWPLFFLKVVVVSVAKFAFIAINAYFRHTQKNEAMITQTLKMLRDANRYTQDNVADYLGIKRSTYSNYETGDREAPLAILEKLACLYGCELYDLETSENDVLQGLIACSFRVDSLSVEDMRQVASFKQLVMNYMKMKKISEQ